MQKTTQKDMISAIFFYCDCGFHPCWGIIYVIPALHYEYKYCQYCKLCRTTATHLPGRVVSFSWAVSGYVSIFTALVTLSTAFAFAFTIAVPFCPYRYANTDAHAHVKHNFSTGGKIAISWILAIN